MGLHDHHRPSGLRVPCAVLTISDTRDKRTDTGGKLIRRLLAAAGHSVVDWQIVTDTPGRIRQWLVARGRDSRVRVMILTGGTGISPRDCTFEVVNRVIQKRLDGFGELFRMLSYGQIGSAAFLSRAVGGVYRGKVVFSLPGSEKAVRLAMTKLILPELCHLVEEITRPAASRKKSTHRT